MPRTLLATTTLLFALITSCGHLPVPISYRMLQTNWSDIACWDIGLVKKEEFTDARLLATFRRFLRLQGPNRKISMLFLAYQERVLVGGGGPYEPWKNNLDPAADIAELFSVRDCAIALIKRGGKTTKLQLTGDHDPRFMTVAGRTVELYEFGIVHWTNKNLVLSIITDPLPSEAEAETISNLLRSYLGASDRLFFLDVNANTHFGGTGGPPGDVFSPSTDESKEAYYATDSIWCSPKGGSTYPGCHVERPKVESLGYTTEQFLEDLKYRKAHKGNGK